MAVPETSTRSQDRSSRLRPFAWMRRLAHRRMTPADNVRENNKKPFNLGPSESKKQKRSQTQSSPILSSNGNGAAYQKLGSVNNGSIGSDHEPLDSTGSATSYRSVAPTMATNPETTLSDGDRQSKAGTSGTHGGPVSTTSGAGTSIFSSPNHSNRSLTTTLTTIQSQATSIGPGRNPVSAQQTPVLPQSSTYFTHQYPTAPVSALPAHMTPHPAHLPTTYRSATANNLLTDNASIITLASSSHRRQRRNSLDTDASIRAIRPSSNWGGSRESLPLSVLSQNLEPASGSAYLLSQSQTRAPAREERASVYSSTGIGVPMLSSERNSIYAGKSTHSGTDAVEGSVRSGMVGHVRNDSSAGSIGGYSSIWPGVKENVGREGVDGED